MFYVLLHVDANIALIIQKVYYAVLFISFLYICTNPFIYTAKFEPVRRVLLRLVRCSNNHNPE